MRDSASADLAALLRAIDAYETFSRLLSDAFESSLHSMTRNAGRTSLAEIAAAAPVREAASRVPGMWSELSDLLQPLGLAVQFDEAFAWTSRQAAQEEWIAGLLEHHLEVQRHKPPDGKNPWFEAAGWVGGGAGGVQAAGGARGDGGVRARVPHGVAVVVCARPRDGEDVGARHGERRETGKQAAGPLGSARRRWQTGGVRGDDPWKSCLTRFAHVESDPQEDGPAYLIEREEKLAGLACAAVLVDQHHCKGSRSLRWDLVPMSAFPVRVFPVGDRDHRYEIAFPVKHDPIVADPKPGTGRLTLAEILDAAGAPRQASKLTVDGRYGSASFVGRQGIQLLLNAAAGEPNFRHASIEGARRRS